ncbi:hypothetical protein PENANT_c017G05665 [Penicillium antarcticum]|uniref:Uncharacterized protein n=1 Tax=Penicillium antarcticum TaxID=416450 RepID=A0A1V6Q212_9EURO|nr:hypothetical protein PENANT_c017G05665 [Penicillium antarcticum]
MSCPDDTHMK